MQDLMIPCPGCQKPVKVTVSASNVFNLETVSSLMIEHSGETLCGCGMVFVPAIGLSPQQQVVFTILPVPPERRKKMVLPPNGQIGRM